MPRLPESSRPGYAQAQAAPDRRLYAALACPLDACSTQHARAGRTARPDPTGPARLRARCALARAYWAITGTGKGCPLLPGSSSPHPTACGPTPSHPRGWAPRRFRSLRSLHKGGARVGARRRPLSRPPPKAAAGRAPAVARTRPRRQATAAFGGAPLGQPGPGSWLRARSLRRCSVAPGPCMRVGRGLPSACAAHPGTLRPSGRLA
uniref:Uncharacterized protein n=1 Tax=uncultured prokaryote TaxID=198431 RepID=A0A0H5PYZ5_9ZZZZ|nr:hypothetical protein [uncultured prokaryote]